ncbi:hypothetical protein N9L68_06745, partial [bacterium]|nr:hypothetical protein [bacterium]
AHRNCQSGPHSCISDSGVGSEDEGVRSLVEATTDSANGIDEDKPEEWDDVEFLVDSGASATVMWPESVNAVSPSDPHPSNNYRLADGSPIPNRGEKSLLGITEEGISRRLKAQVTDADRPLMSVAHIVQNVGREISVRQESKCCRMREQ